MTIIHDSITKKYIYFDEKKRFEISRKFVVDVETTKFVNPTNTTKFMCFTFSTNSIFSVPSNNQLQQYLRKLYILKHYNKEMRGLDNHARLNSHYLVSRHYHRRN